MCTDLVIKLVYSDWWKQERWWHFVMMKVSHNSALQILAIKTLQMFIYIMLSLTQHEDWIYQLPFLCTAFHKHFPDRKYWEWCSPSCLITWRELCTHNMILNISKVIFRYSIYFKMFIDWCLRQGWLAVFWGHSWGCLREYMWCWGSEKRLVVWKVCD